MAEITRRRCGELLRRLFEIILEAPDGLPGSLALEKLANGMALTDYEAGLYASGDRRFEKIVRFATVDCVKAGWLVKHKGTWVVTEVGQQAYKTFPDAEAFYKEAVRLYHQWKANQKRGDEQALPDGQNGDDGEKSASITYETAEEQSWREIEQFLMTMNPYDFQGLVAGLLKAMGYHVSWVSPPGKDGGVDIIAFTDPLGTQSPRIKVQVKRVQQKVDTDGLNAFLAKINERDDVGIFVSTAGFTRDAEVTARSQERRKITLIDMERLVDLWTQYYDRLDDLARRRLPLTPIYFLTPQE